jgi:APA family basic amino acid/polyamine antiporter
MFSQVDAETNMPTNSSVVALMMTGAWFLYFYLTNLAGTWTGPFAFDSTELPIITLYLMYLPMLIQWMRKEKDENVIKRFVLPGLAFCGSVFMVVASIFSHRWGCLWYLIVFGVIVTIGLLVDASRKKK